MIIQLSNVTLTFQHVGLLAQLMHLNLLIIVSSDFFHHRVAKPF